MRDRWQNFMIGDRVKYTGYPIETLGVVSDATDDGEYFTVLWDDGKESTFSFDRSHDPNSMGRVVLA